MKLISLLFLPITWALGFLLPLFAQSFLALGLTDSVLTAYVSAGVVALAWGVMAQLRGSWIWLK